MTRLFYCCLARIRWNRFSRIDAASILRSDSGLCFNFNLSDSLLQIEHLAIGTPFSLWNDCGTEDTSTSGHYSLVSRVVWDFRGNRHTGICLHRHGIGPLSSTDHT